jgi:hypothetical protein
MRTFCNLFLNFRQKGKANNTTRYIHTLQRSSEEQKHTPDLWQQERTYEILTSSVVTNS